MRIYEDLRNVQGRLGVMQYVFAGLMALLAVYFWQLQVVRARYFRALAENNRIRPMVVAAPRGTLLDRHGRILVDNRASFNVILTPEHSDDLGRTIERLAALLRLENSQVRERISRRQPPFQSVVVKADATIDDVSSVEARRLEEPEANVEVVPLRSYPLAHAAAHALGRVGEVTDRQLTLTAFNGIQPGTLVGQAGIEWQYNGVLMGKDGVRRVIVNSRGLEVGEAGREPPVQGPPVTLTLDMDLQKYFEQALGGRPGSAVALDPNTGEILAMISNPSFDPNLFSTGIEAAAWARLVKDPETPLMNRVIQGVYSPGSSFKVAMALAALEERVITPQTTFYCPGYLSIYGTVFRCHKEEGHGTVNLQKAIALSCNVYFYNVGVRLEIERIARHARALGLGTSTGIDLPSEASGLIPDPEWKRRVVKDRWYPSETVSIAIGQGGVLVTPLQMARLAAVVANGGKLVQPHLIKAVADQPAEVPPAVDLHLKPSTLEAVREAMIAVVSEGTGRRAMIQGITVAGKTGSAQVVAHARLEADKKAHELQPHGWFICFAPVENPTIAMAVLVEHGTAGGQSAAPVAGQVLARYFGKPLPSEGVVPAPEPPTATPTGQPPRAAQ